VAHLDEVTVFAEAEVHGISRRDISEAIEKIGSTIKYFAAKRLNTTVLINPLHLHDATAFLITIYEGHNKKQQIYEGDVQSAKEGSWQINKSRNSYPGWLTEVPIIPMN